MGVPARNDPGGVGSTKGKGVLGIALTSTVLGSAMCEIMADHGEGVSVGSIKTGCCEEEPSCDNVGNGKGSGTGDGIGRGGGSGI